MIQIMMTRFLVCRDKVELLCVDIYTFSMYFHWFPSRSLFLALALSTSPVFIKTKPKIHNPTETILGTGVLSLAATIFLGHFGRGERYPEKKGNKGIKRRSRSLGGEERKREKGEEGMGRNTCRAVVTCINGTLLFCFFSGRRRVRGGSRGCGARGLRNQVKRKGRAMCCVDCLEGEMGLCPIGEKDREKQWLVAGQNVSEIVRHSVKLGSPNVWYIAAA